MNGHPDRTLYRRPGATPRLLRAGRLVRRVSGANGSKPRPPSGAGSLARRNRTTLDLWRWVPGRRIVRLARCVRDLRQIIASVAPKPSLRGRSSASTLRLRRGPQAGDSRRGASCAAPSSDARGAMFPSRRVSLRRAIGLVQAAAGFQASGSSSSSRRFGCEPSRPSTSVRYARGFFPWASQVATRE